MPQHRPHRPPTNGTGHGRTRPRQAGLSDQTQRVSEPSVEWCTGFAPAVAFSGSGSEVLREHFPKVTVHAALDR